MKDASLSTAINLRPFPPPLQTAKHAFPCDWCIWVWAPDITKDPENPWAFKFTSGWCHSHGMTYSSREPDPKGLDDYLRKMETRA